MAKILDKFMGRVWSTMAGHNWPPEKVKEHWEQIDAYRMRVRNDHGEMLQHTPDFNADEELRAIFTPVPVAKEMAALSSALLFSEPVKITLPDEEEKNRRIRAQQRQAKKDARNPFKQIGLDPPKPPSEQARDLAKASDDALSQDDKQQQAQDVADDEIAGPASTRRSRKQKLLDELLDENGLDALFQTSGEQIASEGAGALRVIRDREINDGEPYITFVPDDQILWDIKYGRAVMGGTVVWTKYEDETLTDPEARRVVYRMLEEHTAGKIERTVYKGGERYLGKPVEFGSWPEAWQTVKPTETTDLDKPTLIRWENVPGGRSDLAGLESLLDVYNEAESYFTQKGRSSLPLTFADRDLADNKGVVKRAGVHLSKKGMQYGEALQQGIATVQPPFEAEKHIAWVEHVRAMIVEHAGYSSATWGIGEEGRTDSGTALQLRQARTLLTRAGKDRMAREAIRNAIAVALAWKDDASEVADYRPEVTLGLGLPEDPKEKAEAVTSKKTAGVISLRQAIRELHPDWTEDKVDEEIEQIEEEQPATPPALDPRLNPEMNPDLQKDADDEEQSKAGAQGARGFGNVGK